MLKDHDPVVSSLREILDAEEETCFFFRKNRALPEVTELEGLSSYPLKSSCGGGVPSGGRLPHTHSTDCSCCPSDTEASGTVSNI